MGFRPVWLKSPNLERNLGSQPNQTESIPNKIFQRAYLCEPVESFHPKKKKKTKSASVRLPSTMILGDLWLLIGSNVSDSDMPINLEAGS